MIDFGTMTTLVSFLVGLLIGLPIGWVFIGATILGLTVTGTSAGFVANAFFHSLDSATIMAIAFFGFSGMI